MGGHDGEREKGWGSGLFARVCLFVWASGGMFWNFGKKGVGFLCLFGRVGANSGILEKRVGCCLCLFRRVGVSGANCVFCCCCLGKWVSSANFSCLFR